MKQQDLFQFLRTLNTKCANLKKPYEMNKWNKETTRFYEGKIETYHQVINDMCDYMKHHNSLNELGMTDELFNLLKWVKDNNIDIHELRSAYEERRK